MTVRDQNLRRKLRPAPRSMATLRLLKGQYKRVAGSKGWFVR